LSLSDVVFRFGYTRGQLGDIPESSMPVRVELIADAAADLARYAESGALPLFLKELIRLEEVGKDAGPPLGRGLTGWRKIVVGDRDWRIVFTLNTSETVATVWIIGDRDDAARYEDAERLLRAAGTADPHTARLTAAMFEIAQARQAAKKARRTR